MFHDYVCECVCSKYEAREFCFYKSLRMSYASVIQKSFFLWRETLTVQKMMNSFRTQTFLKRLTEAQSVVDVWGKCKIKHTIYMG